MPEENIKFKNILKNAGLSDKETTVYMALLTLGKGTVSQITRKAALNRTTGYDILGNLIAKGLIGVSGKEPRQEYITESPDYLREFIKKEIENKNEILKEVDSVIPELKSLQNFAGRSKVRFYEGTEGLKQVYEDTLTSHELIRAYASVDDVHAALPGYFPNYYKRRTAKNIPIRAIFTDNIEGRELTKHDTEEIRESAFVSAEKYGFHPEINIYDNKVVIASWREKLGIIIESTEIADAMKKIHDLAWEEARRFDNNGT